jgi:hypothetical protein
LVQEAESTDPDVYDATAKLKAGEAQLPAWQTVSLEAAGMLPHLARSPISDDEEAEADASCLQLDAGLLATGDSGPAGAVHLWSTANDQLKLQRSLALQEDAHGVTTLSFQVSSPCAACDPESWAPIERSDMPACCCFLGLAAAQHRLAGGRDSSGLAACLVSRKVRPSSG